MPVTRVCAGEGPGRVPGTNARIHVRISGNVLRIVVSRESIAQGQRKRAENYRSDNQANRDSAVRKTLE
jgi:hypothetical protein